MVEIEPLRGFKATDKKDSWLVESVKELSRQQSLGMNFHDCQLEAWLLGALQVVCWLKSFRRQVPISELVPLSLAYGSGLHGPVRY